MSTCMFAISFLLLLAAGSYNILAQSPENLGMLNQTGSFDSNSSIVIGSEVENVKVTKFNIVAPDTIGIGLKHIASGETPALNITADAISTNYNMIDEAINAINLINATTIGSNLSNTTLSNDEFNYLNSVLPESNGTVTVNAGWKSPTDIMIKLEGNTTLDDANSIVVIVSK